MERMLTRRSLVQRAVGAAGGATAFIVLGHLPRAKAATKTGGNCSVFGIMGPQPGRTQWGPPSCVESCVTVYSPNNAYWGSFCCICGGFCDCAPQYVQVRVTVYNLGGCTATCVPV